MSHPALTIECMSANHDDDPENTPSSGRSYEVRFVSAESVADAGQAILEDAHTVRRDVFIDEQDVSEAEEMDGRDVNSDHWVLYDAEGTPVGTARLRMPESGIAKAERVAVRRAHRGDGLGRWLMELLEERARELDCSCVRLHGQTAVQDFYEQLGYDVVSDEFVEADIPHVEMEKPLK